MIGCGHVWILRRLVSTCPISLPYRSSAIVDASRAPEDAELADALDELDNPLVTTLEEVARHHQQRLRRLVQATFADLGRLSLGSRDLWRKHVLFRSRPPWHSR